MVILYLNLDLKFEMMCHKPDIALHKYVDVINWHVGVQELLVVILYLDPELKTEIACHKIDIPMS